MGRQQDDNDELIANEQPPATADSDFVAPRDDLQEDSFAPAPAPLLTINQDSTVDVLDDDDLLINSAAQLQISKAPPDEFRLVFWAFLLLGTSTMTPWNFFITADDYWMYKFRNITLNGTDVSNLTPMQKSFTCDMTLTASISGTIFLIFNAVYGHHMPLRTKMLSTLGTILALFVLTTALVKIDTDNWQGGFFLVTLATVLIMNSSSALMCGALFGAAGTFPSNYMTAVVSGQALGGILTALVFIFVLMIGAAPIPTALIYFIIGIVLVLLCLIMFLLMEKKPFFKYFIDGEEKLTIIYDEAETSEQSIAETVSLEPIFSEVFKSIYVEALGIMLIFATTISVYPAVTELMQSVNYNNGKAWNDVYFMPVTNYLLFNSGDYVGRLLAGYFEKPKSPYAALYLVVLRNVFVPFFICSNSNVHVYMPVLVHSDAVFIAMMAAFALSNGYLTNLLLISAPRSVRQHERQIASAIMAACLSLGIVLGSAASMIFVQML